MDRHSRQSRKGKTDLAAKSTETGKAIAWLTTIDGLKKEIGELADEASKLLSDIETFKPDREKTVHAACSCGCPLAGSWLNSTR